MPKHEVTKIFEEREIRSVWDDKAEKWYFSVVDVVAALTNSTNPATYWRVLKKRLKSEGNETVTNCNALKLTAADGKMRMTAVAEPDAPAWHGDILAERRRHVDAGEEDFIPLDESMRQLREEVESSMGYDPIDAPRTI